MDILFSETYWFRVIPEVATYLAFIAVRYKSRLSRRAYWGCFLVGAIIATSVSRTLTDEALFGLGHFYNIVKYLAFGAVIDLSKLAIDRGHKRIIDLFR